MLGEILIRQTFVPALIYVVAVFHPPRRKPVDILALTYSLPIFPTHQHVNAMSGFNSGNPGSRFYLLLNYGVDITVWVISINIAELTAIDHDDVRSVCLGCSYLSDKLALKLTWHFVAAGPTTSIREQPDEAEVIEHFGLRAVIGKGGMGPKTIQACQDHKAVYLHAIGGAASLIAHSVKEVVDVYQKDELGVPEAFCVIRVEDFPVVVTMDSHGVSLHAEIKQRSTAALQSLI